MDIIKRSVVVVLLMSAILTTGCQGARPNAPEPVCARADGPDVSEYPDDLLAACRVVNSYTR